MHLEHPNPPGKRTAKSADTANNLSPFLTTDPSCDVQPIRDKAMPATLETTTKSEGN